MSVRLLLTDSIWKTIESVLNDIKSKVGRPPVISDRLFIEAILYVARTGIGAIYLILSVTSLPYTTACDVGN
ncbi:transposase [bacterium]|nr:transposase [bacterium]